MGWEWFRHKCPGFPAPAHHRRLCTIGASPAWSPGKAPHCQSAALIAQPMAGEEFLRCIWGERCWRLRELDGKAKEIFKNFAVGQVSLVLCLRHIYKELQLFWSYSGCWMEFFFTPTLVCDQTTWLLASLGSWKYMIMNWKGAITFLVFLESPSWILGISRDQALIWIQKAQKELRGNTHFFLKPQYMFHESSLRAMSRGPCWFCIEGTLFIVSQYVSGTFCQNSDLILKFAGMFLQMQWIICLAILLAFICILVSKLKWKASCMSHHD